MNLRSNAVEIRIGIDIGGTFTDFVYFLPASGQINTFKLPSTPQDPAQAVLDGLRQIIQKLAAQEPVDCTVVHGSTVATNALLERKGAQTALITTLGFKDVLQIGRQNRPALYDWNIDSPPPLVPSHLRLEVAERIDSSGRVLHPLDPASLEEAIISLRQYQLESVAVCLLFSFLNSEHEQICAQRLRQEGYFVSVSSEILPEYREYERTSTTVVNAYVSPVLSRYLTNLQNAASNGQRLSAADKTSSIHFQVMQSNGGIISLPEAQRNGARCILSGPAGGVIGAEAAGRAMLDNENRGSYTLKLITFDMGGTSTDVSLIDGAPRITTEKVVAGCPIRLPVLDIHTIGAGGGSIASVDLGGALRVGPQSAGADPGPACYSRTSPDSALPTVTDANLLLGRMSPQHFLGGKIPLDPQRSLVAISRLSQKLGLSPQQTALGIIEVVNSHMERALRVISVERGYDPRQFSLLSFGGAGGLHAVELARRLGIRRVFIPRLASTLSAYGMLASDIVKDYSLTVMQPDSASYSDLDQSFQPLLMRAREEMLAEGIIASDLTLEMFLDIRYVGQSYELIVPFTPNFRAEFHRQHQTVYGYARLDQPIEVVNLRVRAVGNIASPALQFISSYPINRSDAFIERRPVTFADGTVLTPFYLGEALQVGTRLAGPAVVLLMDTTVLVSVGWFLSVDVFGNFVVVNGYAK